jgi:predicted SnoaL-like aldol condensation-catalyzing enzyme
MSDTPTTMPTTVLPTARGTATDHGQFAPTPNASGWQAHRFAEILNAGDLAAFDALVAPGYVNHNPFAAPGPDGVKAIFGAFLAALSDFRVTVEDAVAVADRVVGRYTYTGVHTGPLFGYAPTGRPVVMRSIDVWRVGPDGRFVEHWDELNTLDFFQQIGAAVLTAPQPAAPAGDLADG